MTKTIFQELNADKNFSKITKLIQKAGNLQNELDDPRANVIFFAPTNMALGRLEDLIRRHAGRDSMSIPKIEDILSYHVVKNTKRQDRLFDGMLLETNLRNNDLGKNQNQKIRVSRRSGGWVLNMFCHVEESAMMEASNGKVFPIDMVLLPPFDAMITLINEPFIASTFSSAMQQTGVNKDLEREQGVTVFVPANEAWNEINVSDLVYLFSPFGQEDLKKICEYHICTELEYAQTMIEQGGKNFELNTLLKKEQIKVKVTKRKMVKGGERPADFAIVLNDGEAIVKHTDVIAGNGTIHLISSVLIPESVAENLPSRIEGKARLPSDNRRRGGRGRFDGTDDDEFEFEM